MYVTNTTGCAARFLLTVFRKHNTVANKNLLCWDKANQFICILQYYYKISVSLREKRVSEFIFTKSAPKKQINFLTYIVVCNERCFAVCKRKLLRVPSLDKGMAGETDGLGLLEYWFLFATHDFSEFK